MSAHYYILPRASNGLLKLLRYLEREGERRPVLFPANICYTFPLATALTNLKPEFADVDFQTLWLQPESLKLEEYSLIVMVIPYGDLLVNELDELRNVMRLLYQAQGVRVLWDMALVLPTAELMRYIQDTISEGEYFSFSFSYGKQLELGFGALLISPHPIPVKLRGTLTAAETRYYVNKVDKIFKGSLRRYGANTWLHLREHTKVKRCYDSELAPEDVMKVEEIIDGILSGDDPLLILRDGRAFLLSEIVDHRMEMNTYYRELITELHEELHLQEGAITILNRSPLSWRFNLRLPDERLRDEYLKALFSKGFFASRLFPVISRFFGDERRYPNASEHWRRIVNLFNNHLVNTADAEEMIDILREVLLRWRDGATPSEG